ncbi:MAG: phosphatase PAP2-related protein [Candidatus Liptonbacteria bacterium]|nr:phosphatase PAP2-related protein [Candidatus Liptonbacteria bacterium]
MGLFKRAFQRIFPAHRGFWDEERKRSLYLGLLLFVLALIVQVEAGSYSARRAVGANPVGDMFLDNLPVLDLDFIIVQGAIVAAISTVVIFMARPRYLLFGIKAAALFIILRSFFVDLTHVGIYPTSFDVGGIGSRVYNSLTFSGNFFFSGHTGFPFLMALLFWRERFFRVLFLGISVFFGASVLFAHVHYSIDVFAAPFITYSIFVIARKLFPRDYAVVNAA